MDTDAIVHKVDSGKAVSKNEAMLVRRRIACLAVLETYEIAWSEAIAVEQLDVFLTAMKAVLKEGW